MTNRFNIYDQVRLKHHPELPWGQVSKIYLYWGVIKYWVEYSDGSRSIDVSDTDLELYIPKADFDVDQFLADNK